MSTKKTMPLRNSFPYREKYPPIAERLDAMKCFPLVDLFFLTMKTADPDLEQRRGRGQNCFACPTGFSSSLISSFFNPKLEGGGVEFSALFFVHSIVIITCRVAWQKHAIMY